MYKFLCGHTFFFDSLGYTLRGIAGTYDNLCLTEKLPFFEKGLHHFTFHSYTAAGNGK